MTMSTMPGTLAYIITEMMLLAERNLSAYEALIKGDFSVARSLKPFAQIAVDHTIEQTFNRDSNTRGGVIRFSRNPGAVRRWILIAHE